MHFKLDITIAGMCLLVPEAAEDKERLHVLMPRVDSPAETGEAGASLEIPPHTAWLGIDRAYLREGSTRLDGTLEYVKLSGGAVEIAGEGDVAALPREMADVSSIAAVRLDPALLSNGRRVAARLTLRGGKITQASTIGWFTAQTDNRPGAVVSWSAECAEGPLRMEVTPLESGAEPPSIPTLYPVDGQVSLQVLHVPGEAPPDESDLTRSEPLTPEVHFGEFFPLMGKPSPVIPVFEQSSE